MNSNLNLVSQELLLKFLAEHNAYYECPKDETGKRLGPLVGYAGKYLKPGGSTYVSEQANYVGEVYYNIAALERKPQKLRKLTGLLSDIVRSERVHGRLRHTAQSDIVLLAAPMGGLSCALQLSENLDLDYTFAEKKVTKAATEDGQREESVLVMGRHEICPGQEVFLVEDVCNNFSTTKAIKHLVESFGAKLVRIICLVNRSPADSWEGIPVISLGHIPTAQYQQGDPFVVDDVAAGNVVWKPKLKWPELMETMRRAANTA
ncbi:hypothetical protein A2810_00280 [candidate division Kazan bacterium RIFCSPHIGHO2_01_FULL_49_10]|uniref:Phosphoribosyltransferase domain-containing protein n=1 Tax=candidate division Kazan bacterium RIFCSPLOWO2_01_FULL_48_13 TaxID=1798539 RepID=A0A1F4PP09_UNCK3|nr:MAG: hypothetical protein A2810_00280 [candidate division Kazan bacterium RIFCSPHIGHO2_01_FULL_49_10]OGB85583.1 MAG: hypothetical protein A2994_01000 [candidate division Kazan bacterium RIFCSPLOWO2_01_FULL_48_13]